MTLCGTGNFALVLKFVDSVEEWFASSDRSVESESDSNPHPKASRAVSLNLTAQCNNKMTAYDYAVEAHKKLMNSTGVADTKAAAECLHRLKPPVDQ